MLPRADWIEGRKVRVWFRGEEMRDSEAAEQARKAEHQARLAAEQQAAQEHQARRAAEQEIARLLARLQQAGLDQAGEM
jgi:hypothetical protein